MRRMGRLLLVLAFLFAVSASWWLGREFGRRDGNPPSLRPDTVLVTKWVHDTVEIEGSRPAGTVQAWLPKVEPEPQAKADTVQNPEVKAKPDTVLVEVPIEEKAVSGENYRAILRGFQPEIVDIWVKENTQTIRVPVRKRWSVTAGPQVGIGITPDGWRPYAGVGVTFGYCF